jgi:replicative DNA helicase
MARLISMTMEVDASKVFFPTKETLTDEDTDRIVIGADRISKWKMRIDNNAKDIDKLISKARRLKASMGLDMIVIDYIQLLHDSAFVGGNRSSELESISGKLKGLALELEVPVIALSQLSRSVEKSGAGKTKDRHGDISDIKDSGSIEQDADVIMFLYRDAYYDEKSTSNLAEISIKKQRNGEQKKIRCHFLGNYSKFIPLADESNYSQ